MEEELIFFLIEVIAKHLDTDRVYLEEAYQPALSNPVSHTPSMPPAVVLRLLRLYLDYPDFYSARAARIWASLPPDDTLVYAVFLESSALVLDITERSPRMTVSNVLPLPVVTFINRVDFQSAFEYWSASVRFGVELYPAESTAEFDRSYWLICSIVRTMFLTNVLHGLNGCRVLSLTS